MRERRPSQTAAVVALIRALADQGLTDVPGFEDPVVHRLLSRGWSAALTLFARRLRRMDAAKRARVLAELSSVPLRVMAIDVELKRAVEHGCRQVASLGAGLDTRAFRMKALSAARFFEIDHPATQAFKQRKAAGLTPLVERLTYVPVDFERDALAARLSAAGHRPDEPTAWVWEGVVMYLSDEALRSTLRALADASAPGSVLLVNYLEPPMPRREQRIVRLLTRLWSEPLIGLRRREAMLAEVERAGFHGLRDTGTADWARQFGAPFAPSNPAANTRLLVAERRGPAAAPPPARPPT
ncbi:class I SAM-dependent methyltransferase [Sorangium sp. So ce1000]|uniref:class I SAM-dependent methyltransferase n=1 Tax=Sorangium sp. So ce1000 TaxID=3133325 RepID=UPI003F62B77E